MAQVNFKSDEELLNDMVVLALAHSNRNQQQAAKWLQDRMEENEKLKQSLLNPLLPFACQKIVGEEIRKNRKITWNYTFQTNHNQQRERLLAVAESRLMNFPLPGGKTIGNATREEIMNASFFYMKQAKDMTHKAVWLRLVAHEVPTGKIASDVMTDDRLRDLQTEAMVHE